MTDSDRLKTLLEKSRQAKQLNESKQEAAATQAYLDNPVPVPNVVAKQQMTEREWTNLCIIRQTCIKASAEIYSVRPTAPDDDILKLAEKFEQWVVRK